ncbi:MAG: IclR family transcriptional regulator [Planctomycetota bacterium]
MPNNTLKNGFRLLETMARQPRPWSVAELAAHLALPRSHVHRLLTTLVELGYLTRPRGSQAARGARRYQVDVKLFELAGALAAEQPLRRMSGAVLRRLADQTRGSAYLIVWHDEAPLILAADHFGGRRTGEAFDVGKRLDRYTTASGRLFLALRMTPGDLETLLVGGTRGELPAKIDAERLRGDLATIRATSFAEILNPAAWALPVYDRDEQLIAAIGLVVSVERRAAEGAGPFIRAAAEAARQLSAALGSMRVYAVDPDAGVLHASSGPPLTVGPPAVPAEAASASATAQAQRG